jgi:ribosomal protein S18 acetylase RimI-like enzyme
MIISVHRYKRAIISSIGIVAVLVSMGYFLQPTVVHIYDYDPIRDQAFILNIFKNNWDWLVAAGSQFSPEYMLANRSSSQESGKIGDQIIKVMYEHDKPVGFVAYHKKNFYKCMLHFIAVDQNFRNKGYGLKLLQYAIRDMISWGCAEIILVTRTTNISAQTIYKKAGFKETSRQNGFVYFAYTV